MFSGFCEFGLVVLSVVPLKFPEQAARLHLSSNHTSSPVFLVTSYPGMYIFMASEMMVVTL